MAKSRLITAKQSPDLVGIEFLFFKIASKLSETNDQLIRGGKKKGCNCVGKGRVKSFLNIY